MKTEFVNFRKKQFENWTCGKILFHDAQRESKNKKNIQKIKNMKMNGIV